MNRFRARIFALVIGSGVAFLLFTTLAMLVYPGGSHADKSSVGYEFTLNFFSDLGRTRTLGKHPNPLSSIMFSLALGLAGIGLGAFWLCFAPFFGRRFVAWKIAAWLGSFFGLIAGLGFIGVALTPANINGHLHADFVAWAFRAFLLATLIYTPILLFDGGFPRFAAWFCIAFAAILAAYIWLLLGAFPIDTVAELRVQATGQKLVVYASVACVGALAFLARRKLDAELRART
jgi:hypothetical protein